MSSRSPGTRRIPSSRDTWRAAANQPYENRKVLFYAMPFVTGAAGVKAATKVWKHQDAIRPAGPSRFESDVRAGLLLRRRMGVRGRP